MLKYTMQALLAMLLFYCPTAAQQLTIVDQASQKPIEDVVVHSADFRFSALSDQNGQVNIIEAAGEQQLGFQHAAFLDTLVSMKSIREASYKVALSASVFELPTFSVSASRVRERLDEVTNRVEVIGAQSIANHNPQTSADLLTLSGAVYVQKSQMGGGSPVIRGFEANKVLLVVDGIRMNNAIYRGGHLQNVITVDPVAIERAEVVMGPGSLVYGSDALGGVMHFTTRHAAYNDSLGLRLIPSGGFRFSSANREQHAFLNLEMRAQKWSALTTLSFSDFDDLRIGKWRPHGYEDWGLNDQYVNDKDSIVINESPETLRYTGYNQQNFLQKFRVRLSPLADLTINLQYSTSSNIPRYDKLNDRILNADDISIPKFAEWNYGPQERLLSSVHIVDKKRRAVWDEFSFNIAFQKINEQRLQRRWSSGSNAYSKIRQSTEEEVLVYSSNFDALKRLSGGHQLQYGFELSLNEVDSGAYLVDISDENTQLDDQVQTRYPDGGSGTDNQAVYLRHKWKLNSKWSYSSGIRMTRYAINASFVNQDFFVLPESDFSEQHLSLTAGIGLQYTISKRNRLFASLNNGFRTPNVDDVGKVFSPDEAIVVVPNLDVDPESALHAELGWEKEFSPGIKLFAAAWISYLRNAIVRRPYTIAGQDSLMFEDEMMAVHANTNAGEARLAGFDIAAVYKILPKMQLEKKFNFVRGRDLSEDVPLGHIPPPFGSLKWSYNGSTFLSTDIEYNFSKPLDQYGPGSTDKANEATAEGTPFWFTWNVNFSYPILKDITLSAAIENLLDMHYVPFASGISGPGRNFVISLRWQ